MSTVLLAVAEPDQLAFLEEQLSADAYSVVPAATYAEAVLGAQTDAVGAVIVDLGLPDHDGLRLVREIRAGQHLDLPAELPILALLMELGGELHLVRAYGAGVDDSAWQPVPYHELRCRLGALLRRATRTGGHTRRRRIGALQIDLHARTARVADQLVVLSRLEFDLLAVLSGDPHRVFTKHELLGEIWGTPQAASTRTLDSHACRLRHHLTQAGGAYVTNRWGVGYSLLPPQ